MPLFVDVCHIAEKFIFGRMKEKRIELKGI